MSSDYRTITVVILVCQAFGAGCRYLWQVDEQGLSRQAMTPPPTVARRSGGAEGRGGDAGLGSGTSRLAQLLCCYSTIVSLVALCSTAKKEASSTPSENRLMPTRLIAP